MAASRTPPRRGVSAAWTGAAVATPTGDREDEEHDGEERPVTARFLLPSGTSREEWGRWTSGREPARTLPRAGEPVNC